MAHYVIRIARNAGIVALFIIAAMLGILSGVLFAYAGDLPQVSALDDYAPSTITRLYANDGRMIGEYATQRRVIVGYDVEAASRLYFNKTNKQLNLEEAALIAGIFQTPERQSPFVDMKRAVARRNIVLQRMADERYITQAQADEAKAKPIVTRGQPNEPPGIAPYFVEEVRKHLEKQYGAKVLYENGLAVTTTLDPRLQDIATKALEHGLRAYDKRHGWRRATRNVLDEGHTIDGFRDERWARPF